MRKSVFFLMTIMVMMVSGNLFAQKSKFYTGDKSAREIKKSQQVYWDQIEDLESRIGKLKKENQKLAYRLQASSTSDLSQYYADQGNRNDSLIEFYQSQADLLRQQCSDFTNFAGSKDVQTYLDLRTRKTNDLVQAYTIARYLEGNGGYQNAQEVAAEEKEQTGGLRGIVENQWYRDVNVTITGPGNFRREFFLKAEQKSNVFPLPIPGNYRATFSTGFESKTVVKPVGPSIIYYDNGNGYDFRAVLPQ